MFERMNDQSIKVLALAQEETRRNGHNLVRTEHLLLGIVGESSNSVSRALKSDGIEFKVVRDAILRRLGKGSTLGSMENPFSPRAKRALEFSWDEARLTGSNNILPEHLFLGIWRQTDCGAHRVLSELNLNPEALRMIAAWQVGSAPLAVLSEHLPPEATRKKLKGRADDIQVALEVFNELSFTLATMQDAFARLELPAPAGAHDEFVELNERLAKLDAILEEAPGRLRAEIALLRESLARILRSE